MDLLSTHYAAPSLLFCERGMQDLHLKTSGAQGKKLHTGIVRSTGRIFGEVGDALDMALCQGGAVLYVRVLRAPFPFAPFVPSVTSVSCTTPTACATMSLLRYVHACDYVCVCMSLFPC
jgi:hypothetical protein